MKHPQDLETLLTFDPKREVFYFQQSLNIDAINKETLCIDRKAHLFWEIATIDAKVKELMSILSHSGQASTKLIMTGDSKDARNFFIIKKKEQERGLIHELSFVDSIYDVSIQKNNRQNTIGNKSIQQRKNLFP